MLNPIHVDNHTKNPCLSTPLGCGQILYKNNSAATSAKIITGKLMDPNIPVRQAKFAIGSRLVTIAVDTAAID
jgi:hypothetical protein